MAIDDLPLPVVNFLNAIGVPWPYANEDTVTRFASLVREFRGAVAWTHQDAAQSLEAIARAHRGVSTQAMMSGWANLSARHVDEIVAAATVLADGLDAAAAYIVAQKAEAIVELAGMAAAFFADQAAAVATAGLAEAALPLIIDGAEKLVESLAMDLEQYVAGQVIGAAAKPLFTAVEAALAGLDWSHSGAQAGTPAWLEVHPAAVRAQTAALRGQAAALRGQAAVLAGAVRGLRF